MLRLLKEFLYNYFDWSRMHGFTRHLRKLLGVFLSTYFLQIVFQLHFCLKDFTLNVRLILGAENINGLIGFYTDQSNCNLMALNTKKILFDFNIF